MDKEAIVALQALIAVLQAATAYVASVRMYGMKEVIRNIVGVLIIIIPSMGIMSACVLMGMSQLSVAIAGSASMVIGSISTASGKLARIALDGEDDEWMKRS